MARLLPAKWVWWYRDKRCAMGYSKRIYNDKKWNKTVAPLRPTFESLGLKEDDVARLHEQFLKIDKDGSGTIELWEMLDHLDLKRNRFAKRVFAIFDVDGSNEIDFKEFVVALWQYSLAIAVANKSDPSRHVYYSNRSECFLRLGQFEKALSDADAALAIDPDHARSHKRRQLAVEHM